MTYDKEFALIAGDFQLTLNAALECLAWSEVDEEGNPLDSFELEFDEESRALIGEDLKSFFETNRSDLDGLDLQQIGHDFILTRNGHGAGFWDRGLGAIGERLSDSARPYGSITAFVLNGALRAE
jgi:hypothetical protein